MSCIHSSLFFSTPQSAILFFVTVVAYNNIFQTAAVQTIECLGFVGLFFFFFQNDDYCMSESTFL